MNRYRAILASGVLALLALAAVALDTSLPTPPAKARESTASPRATAMPSKPSPKKSPPTPQVATVPQEYGKGLYRLEASNYETVTLTKQFPSIALWMETGYTEDGEIPPDYPSTVNVADMRIPSKNLRLAAIYSPYPRWCEGVYCPFELQYSNAGRWKGIFSGVVSPNQYLLVEDSSISLILCEEGRKGYMQYRLSDGRLERPITVVDGEYFTAVGPFDNPALAPCR